MNGESRTHGESRAAESRPKMFKLLMEAVQDRKCSNCSWRRFRVRKISIRITTCDASTCCEVAGHMPYDRNGEATNAVIKALAKNVQAAHGGGSGSENIHKEYDV